MGRSSQSRVRDLLSERSLLKSLPEADIDELVSNVRQYDLVAGATIYSQGTPGSHIYWVESGRLRLTVTSPGGGEALYSMVEVGGYCGHLSALDGGLRPVSAVADRRTHLIGLDGRYLMPVLERNPKACLNIARLLCTSIRIAGDSIENLALKNSEERIWSHLTHLSKQYGERDAKNKSMRIEHGLSQQSLADSVGLTRVMVNRQLRAWRDAGLTEDGRGFVVLLDPEALEAHVWRRSNSE